MKKLAMMLMTVGLLLAAAPYGSSSATPNAPKKDKMAASKKAEERGDLARLKKEYAVAEGYYQAAIHDSRKDANLYNKLGIVELQRSERGAARRDFSQALKIDPQFVSAINNLGAVALLDKRYKLAVDYFKQALAKDESVASTHLNLAEAWLGMGEAQRAMTEYARALELNADLLSNSEDGVIAQVATPEQRARIAFMIAKSYAKRGNIDGAIDYLGRAKLLHYPNLSKVYTDPDFATILPDPRLAKIVAK
jgi:tetratricopeptide (TPR) repeat protein